MATTDRSRYATLSAFADDGFQYPDTWNRTELAMSEIKRVKRLTFMATYAAQVPRRLGPDATPQELTVDKRTANRVGHTYLRLWQWLVVERGPMPAWDLPDAFHPPDDWRATLKLAASDQDARRAGASVEWRPWWTDLRPRLLGRRAGVATFALREGHLDWGYRLVTGLSRELSWVERALIDAGFLAGIAAGDD